MTNLHTDPYGDLTFAIGTDDDFWCFDYDFDTAGETVRLHAVINSETGCFIQDAEPPVEVPLCEAVAYAEYLVDRAIAWCDDCDIDHDSEGWNQQPDNFVNAIKRIAQA